MFAYTIELSITDIIWMVLSVGVFIVVGLIIHYFKNINVWNEKKSQKHKKYRKQKRITKQKNDEIKRMEEEKRKLAKH